MNTFTPEMIEKAKTAATAEELMALAKENNWEMTQEEADAYFAQLHPVTGEMTDDELENVAGGGCHNRGKLVVTATHGCIKWTCKRCGTNKWIGIWSKMKHQCPDGQIERPPMGYYCAVCKMCTYERGLWLCNHPDNCK